MQFINEKNPNIAMMNNNFILDFLQMKIATASNLKYNYY